MKMAIGTKNVDFERAFPMTLGDLCDLTEAKVFNHKGEMVQDFGPIEMKNLVFHFAKKAEPSVAESDIRGMTIPELEAVAKHINEEMAKQGPLNPS